MNQILDIIAKPTPEAQTPEAVPVKGRSTGDDRFAKAFAEAVSDAPARSAAPAAPAGVVEPANVAAVKGGTALVAELLNGVPEAIGEGVVTTGTDILIDLPVGDSATDPKSDPSLVALFTNASGIVGAGQVAQAVTPAMSITEQLTILAEPAIQPAADLALQKGLQQLLEGELSATTAQKSPPIAVQAQVEIPLEVASALADADAAAVGAPNVTDSKPLFEGALVSPTLPQTTASLRAQLRKAFPRANIEAATGKLNIQVKLANAQTEAKAVVETPLSPLGAPKANDLPIAAGHQIVQPLSELTQGKRAVRVGSKSSEALNSKVATNPEIANAERSLRNEPKVAIRKPVLQALKAQGFDLDKLISLSEKSETLAVIGGNDEKVAVRVLDKQVPVVADRSFELSGIERFKLDVKRGQIETLLRKGEIKLQLQPDHLGTLKIRLITNPTEVNARLETSSEAARRSVEASLPQLRESFERAGLKLNSIEVVVGDDTDSRRRQASQQDTRGRDAMAKRQANEIRPDVPAIAEMAQNRLSAYAGALNLVA